MNNEIKMAETPEEVADRLEKLCELTEALKENFIGEDSISRNDAEEIVATLRSIPVVTFNV